MTDEIGELALHILAAPYGIAVAVELCEPDVAAGVAARTAEQRLNY